ncbi:unnamed protein product [Ectocarpus sp. 12 AP-2014]
MLAGTPPSFNTRSRAPKTGVSFPADWKPPLATAAGIGGVPFTGPAPAVPRPTRFKEENLFVEQYQQYMTPPHLRGKPRRIPLDPRNYKLAVVQQLFG